VCEQCKQKPDARGRLRPLGLAELRRSRGKATQTLAVGCCRQGRGNAWRDRERMTSATLISFTADAIASRILFRDQRPGQLSFPAPLYLRVPRQGICTHASHPLGSRPPNLHSPLAGDRVSSAKVCSTFIPSCLPQLPHFARCQLAGRSRPFMIRPCALPGLPESRNFMPETREASVEKLQPGQAIALCKLVEMEACWENLRRTPSSDPTVTATKSDLLARQKAYDVFRARLVAYNKECRPQHVPELLLNNPSRLGTWCRRMRDLFLLVQHDAECQCPVSLVEKAYWCADRISLRLNEPCVRRSTTQTTMEGAILALEALSRWCDALASVAVPGSQAVPPPSVPTLPS
jgi:hypothetical protein